MNDTKPVAKSLTIQTVAVTMLVVLYHLVGTTFFGLPELPDFILETLVGAGLLLAGYGRIRADTKLK